MKSAEALRIVSGVSWNAVELVASKGVTMLVRLVLAALVAPQEFGVVGMALLFTGLAATVSETGFSEAIIQRKKSLLDKKHLDSAFWLSMVSGAAIFLIMVAIVAPLAARFYGIDRVATLIRVLSVGLLLNPLRSIHAARLRRVLRFRLLALTGMGATLLGGLAGVGVAWAGGGAWSFVALDLTRAAVMTGVLWAVCSWRPRWHWSWKESRDLMGFSLYTWAIGIFIYVRQNLDYLLVSRLLGAAVLGLYTLAFTLTDIVRQEVTAVVNTVMFPAMSRLQDDREAVLHRFLLVTKYNALLMMPFLVALIVFGDIAVALIFGPQWSGAGLPLQILAFGNIIFIATGQPAAVFKAVGRPDLQLRISAVNTLVVAVPALCAGIWYGGINGAAVAVCVYHATARAAFHAGLKKVVGLETGPWLRSLTPAFAAAAGMAIAGLILRLAFGNAGLWGLVVAVLLSGLAYLAAAFFAMRRELPALWSGMRAAGRS
jgi:O-antigen/teichoic acid export membrane protein